MGCWLSLLEMCGLQAIQIIGFAGSALKDIAPGTILYVRITCSKMKMKAFVLMV
jgi:hypothetical protein